MTDPLNTINPDSEAEEGEFTDSEIPPAEDDQDPPRVKEEDREVAVHRGGGGWRGDRRAGAGGKRGGKPRPKTLLDERWDDTVLIEAWDAAVAEYQLYHSDKAPTPRPPRPPPAPVRAASSSALGSKRKADEGVGSGLRDKEVDGDASYVSRASTAPIPAAMPPIVAQVRISAQNYFGDFVEPNPATMTQFGEDEDLANVMMAWYYVGYYSGVYAAK
ncbi:hypothetical protein BDK51DRAFT_27061, partial [Blyttiomyces helicus]